MSPIRCECMGRVGALFAGVSRNPKWLPIFIWPTIDQLIVSQGHNYRVVASPCIMSKKNKKMNKSP